MITTKGKNLIKRYLANQSGGIAGALVLGTSGVAANVADTRLGFESVRIPVDIVSYDYAADKLIFKGTIPADVQGTFYEVGIFTDEASSSDSPSMLIVNFDQFAETWTNDANGSWDTTQTRVGPDCLKQAPATSSTSTSTLTDLQLDMSMYSSADTVAFALYSGNAFASNVKLRFMTDASNYYEFTFSSIAAGYSVKTATIGSATIVGTPYWDDIEQIQIVSTATSGGAAAVYFDGIRIEDTDAVTPTYGLIAHYIPASPIAKPGTNTQDFEYTLAVTVT